MPEPLCAFGPPSQSAHPPSQIDTDSWTDCELRIAAISTGPTREIAWSVLVRKHGPAIRTAIEVVLLRNGGRPDPHAVDDLVESTWLRVTRGGFKKLRDWKPTQGASLKTLLVIIGKGEALRWCRFRANRREVFMNSLELQQTDWRTDSRLAPDQIALSNELAHEIAQWEVSLRPFERQALLQWKDGNDQATIGRNLNRSQQCISRTILRLKEDLHLLLTHGS